MFGLSPNVLTKLASARPPSGAKRVGVVFVLLCVLKNTSHGVRRALFASGFADDRRRTTDERVF